MFNNIQFTCILVVFYGIYSSLGQTLPDETLYKDNACYGSSTISYFHSNCSINHAIAVSKVLGGAKPNTTGCPPEVNWDFAVNFSACCVFSPRDCIEEFSGALKTYHDGCSGQEVCKFGTGVTRYSFVNCQEPLVNNLYNSYMELDYYCIDKTTIGSTCTPVTMITTGKALYLWNSGYPLTATADCNCSIEVNSSTAKIEVMTLRIELFGNSSSCIRFLDGVCDTRETVLCSNVSTITYAFTSTSNYLLMQYVRRQITDSGRYWIRFKATNSSANLTLKCQPESKPVCTTTMSTTTTPSTTTSTTTPSNTKSTTTPSTTTFTTTSMSTTTSTTTPPTTTSTTTPSTTKSTTTTPSTTTNINTTTNITTTTKTATITSTNTPKASGTTQNTTGTFTPLTTSYTSNSTTTPVTSVTEEKSPTNTIIGAVTGVAAFVLLIVVIVIIHMKVIKPARNREAITDGKGNEYVNTAFWSDISTTGHESLQRDQTRNGLYEANERISSVTAPSTGEQFYDKLHPYENNQEHAYSSLSSPRLDDGKIKTTP